MVLPNSTVARARRTGIVQRSSNSTPENNEALPRRSSIAVLPTAFATAENNTTKGRRVSIVELMIAAKKEAAAQQEGSDDNAKKSIFDIFPDEQEEDDDKSGKPKKKTAKPTKKASKSNNKKGAAPKTKMSAAPKGAPGGAGKCSNMLLLGSLGTIKNLSIFKDLSLDDWLDQMNRTFMFLLLCFMGTIVAVGQYTGKNISCDGFTKFTEDFSQDYCWTQGLYTIKEAYDLPESQIPYPGIIPENVPSCRPHTLKNGGKIVCPPESEVKPLTRARHLWYQWIPFYFWVVAPVFYLPYMFVKRMGLDRMKPLLKIMSDYYHCTTETPSEEIIIKCADWVYNSIVDRLSEGSSWTSWRNRHGLGLAVLASKFMYLGGSVLVMVLTSVMFQVGDFQTYGYDWITQFPEPDNYSTSVKHKLFPKMVACEIKRWGTTGLEEENGMCVLTPNVIYQYVFLIMWFALTITIFTNFGNIFFYVFKLTATRYTYSKLVATGHFSHKHPGWKFMYYRIGTSGRVLLNIVAQNTNPIIFGAIMEKLCPSVIKHLRIGHVPGEYLTDPA
ncbi:innexin inx7-like isoform X2 [Bolinopsis microptera]|uniref:innexin inx7-like isoform X2 n=1 Tax=Bolinopsis microptera TaxID=2820187 RepID=UPI003079CA2E